MATATRSRTNGKHDTPDAEVIEATAVEVYRQPAPAALFGTDDPVEVIEKATRVATALKDVVARCGLVSLIEGKEFPRVEAWQTLGSMLGVFPIKEWVREKPWPDPVPEALREHHKQGLAFGFEASFSATRTDGAVIGGGEAICLRTESNWINSPDYALESMAQTRATSKALAAPLRFVMTLAGYQSTPAEEMEGLRGRGSGRASNRPAPKTTAKAAEKSERKVTVPQKRAITDMLGEQGIEGKPAEAIVNWIGGVSALDRLTLRNASAIITRLGEDGGAQAILDEILAKAEEGDERASTIVARYGELIPDA